MYKRIVLGLVVISGLGGGFAQADYDPNFEGGRFADEFLADLKQRPIEEQREFLVRWYTFSKRAQDEVQELNTLCNDNQHWADVEDFLRRKYNGVKQKFTSPAWVNLPIEKIKIRNDERSANYLPVEKHLRKMGYDYHYCPGQKSCSYDAKRQERDLRNIDLAKKFDAFTQEWLQQYPEEKVTLETYYLFEKNRWNFEKYITSEGQELALVAMLKENAIDEKTKLCNGEEKCVKACIDEHNALPAYDLAFIFPLLLPDDSHQREMDDSHQREIIESELYGQLLKQYAEKRAVKLNIHRQK